MASPVVFRYAKPIWSLATVVVGALALVITGDVTFSDVTTAQWLIIVGTILANGGAVFGVTGLELVNPPATAFEIDQSDPDEPGEHRAE